ncbi:pyruvate dehydrogenase phosphatase regulatory subunit, mitochondrial [Neocloeon triangulifer]|uniref:pyruvate dehydrogenase phosphatase regulatory subunit, mitochondrial n=1 Tax=Neocloeon triangulifer TaxID=2078957 RepID=UPI00286F10B7|nr:pyruvate dehydrogenase phosphatase regulatory subunit, mitochondrial [Neocloeon triangulifer]
MSAAHPALYLRAAKNRPLLFRQSIRLINQSQVESTPNEDALPSKARVVICGGGVQGAAVAYELAKLGLGNETVLLEQGRLGGGSTWHSTGLVSTLRNTYTETRLAKDSVALYNELDAVSLKTGWRQCGSLSIARTKDRMTMFRRIKARAQAWKIPCEIISVNEVASKCPIILTSDVLGGLWVPGDGVGDPYEICVSLIAAAKKKDVKIVENCYIQKVLEEKGRVSAVETNKGTIQCDVFVNCGGLWARRVGKLSQTPVKVPLHPAEHYCLHTKVIPGLDPNTPVVKDEDGQIYFRENEGKLLIGGFELSAKPAFEDGKVPDNFSHQSLIPDWDHFHVLLEQMLHRIPSLSDVVVERLCNGPEAFSPDGKWILGEAPEVKNYYVAAGANTVGLTAAGGLAKATAGLIVGQQGVMPADSYDLELSRFLGLHNNRRFLRDRVKEVPGMHFKLPYPFQEFTTGRNLRMSPIYPRLRQDGAVFGQVMGYERPSYFDTSVDSEAASSADSPDYEQHYGLRPYRIANTNTFGKPPWFDIVESEYTACRETVGLSDYSSFTKMDLWSKGPEVIDFLQRICSNDVDIPIGGIIHTGMQNERGGYENDCSFARLAENRFMMIAPTIQQTRCKAWMKRHKPSDGSVAISDVTSMYTAICVMGPHAIPLLSELADVDLNPTFFPFFTFKELDVGLASGIRAMNLTHTGELGCVLYIPNEFALHVYSGLVEFGKKYGLQHCGYYAMRALRIEKFYAFWGQDLDTSTTPLECGRSFRVKFDKKENFIGKDALLKQREEGVKRMYVQLILQDHDPEVDLWPWGGEPILRDGRYVGATTTTGYGFTLGRQVCLGFVQNRDEKGNTGLVTTDYVLSGEYQVDIAGVKYEAKVNLHSPVLPTKYTPIDPERLRYQATRPHIK